MDEQCVIPGCARPGKHRLGVRCRIMREPSPVEGKKKTHALWSVESDTWLCDAHALDGLEVTLLLEPNKSRTASIRVVGPQRARTRRLPIRARRDVGQ